MVDIQGKRLGRLEAVFIFSIKHNFHKVSISSTFYCFLYSLKVYIFTCNEEVAAVFLKNTNFSPQLDLSHNFIRPISLPHELHFSV